MPKKVDLCRLHREEYVAPRNPRVITVGKAQYLAICGRGAPRDAAFRSQMNALFGMAYAVKMAKKKLGKDFQVCPLEGLWWDREPTESGEGSAWSWKLLIRVPTFVRRRDLAAAAAQLATRGRGGTSADVKLEQLKEGRCIQVMHVGPDAAEGRTIERMRRAAQELGLAFHGRHHEVYLSDPRRVPPERMRTILRQPVRAAR